MSTYMGLAVPLYPSGPILIDEQSATATDDILTLEAAASQTGDYLVCRNSSGTERFVVQDGGNIVITQSAAADHSIAVTQFTGASGDAIQINNVSASKVFQVNSAGEIKTMVLGTYAIASVASNASTSFSVAGVTTDSVIHLFPTKALTTGNGVLQAYAQGTTRVDVFAEGGSVAANTYAAWAFKVAAN